MGSPDSEMSGVFCLILLQNARCSNVNPIVRPLLSAINFQLCLSCHVALTHLNRIFLIKKVVLWYEVVMECYTFSVFKTLNLKDFLTLESDSNLVLFI